LKMNNYRSWIVEQLFEFFNRGVHFSNLQIYCNNLLSTKQICV
jgi:hypothetical protein